MSKQAQFECQYECGETFETEHERGVHIAEEHTDPDQSITQKSYAEDKRTDLIDEYEKNNKGKAQGGVA